MTHNDLSSAANTVDVLVEAYNAHDACAFAALFAEDAVAYGTLAGQRKSANPTFEHITRSGLLNCWT
jgi:hypothetical protein